MNEYDKISQTLRRWQQAVRRHPVKVLLVLLALASLTIGRSFLSAIGDQLARPKPLLEGEKNKQIASIEFENRWPFVAREVYGDEQINVYYFKVKIHNKSQDTIRARYLKLSDLRAVEGDDVKPWRDADPVVLGWDAITGKAIPPQDEILVSFARIFPPELQRKTDKILSGDIDIPQLRFTVDGWPRKMTSHVPPGTHRFKLTVYFEKTPPAETELELKWTGKQRGSLESMVQEIKIRKLEN